MEAGEDAALGVIVRHPEESRVGSRILYRGGERAGTSGDSGTDAAFEDLARRGLGGDPKVVPGLHTLSFPGGGEVVVYLELHHPPAEMIIVGAGHVGQPLCTLGALLGFRVTVMDDRPEFATRERFPEASRLVRVDFADPFRDVKIHAWSHVILVTRGHRYDYECLRRVLQNKTEPLYLGMIGSRRRVRATFEALLAEGFPHEQLRSVRAPIGIDIGAETPAEIAVCVAAEIVQVWRGGSGHPLSEVERVLDRFLPEADEELPPHSRSDP